MKLRDWADMGFRVAVTVAVGGVMAYAAVRHVLRIGRRRSHAAREDVPRDAAPVERGKPPAAGEVGRVWN